MLRPFTPVLVVALRLACQGLDAADDPSDQASPASESQPVLFLGVGDVVSAGQIVQVDLTGKILGKVDLPGTPYSLASTGDFVFAAVPRAGRIYRIFRNGNVTPLASTGGVDHPLSIAVDPKTEQIFVGDNAADRIVRMTPGQAEDDVLQIQQPDNQLQNLSLGVLSGSKILISGSQPPGVYIGDFETGMIGPVLLPDEGGLAVQLGTDIWAVAQREVIKVFSGTVEKEEIPLPKGGRLYRSGLLSFLEDGKLLITLNNESGTAVVRVDVETDQFETLFVWNGARLVTMATGRRMDWDNDDQAVSDFESN